MVQAHLTYLAPSAVLLVIAVAGAWWPSASPDPAPVRGSRRGSRRGRSSVVVVATRAGGGAGRAGAVDAPAVAAGAVVARQPQPGAGRRARERVRPGDRPSGSTCGGGRRGFFPAFAGTRLSLVDELGELHSPAGAGGVDRIGAARAGAAGDRLVRAPPGPADVLIGALISLGLAVAAVATSSAAPVQPGDRGALRDALDGHGRAGALARPRLGRHPVRSPLPVAPRAARPPGAAIAVPALIVVALLIPRSRSLGVDG